AAARSTRRQAEVNMESETEVIVAQIGLILGQLRFTRRAMEDIERSLARYGGVAVSTALQAGARFGEPPLLDGALQGYVVNINDLAPGVVGGGLLEALLGGAGRFVGGLLGGIAGGALGSMVWIDRLATLAATIERILDRLGLRGGTSVNTPAASRTSATSGPNLTEALPEIRRTIQALTGLFTAAASGPDAAGRALGQPPRTLAGQQWLDALATFSDVLQGMSLVVDGLTRLVVVLIGALATLVTRLDSIKLAIVDLFQFALRNVFLLRGVTLVTIYDTLSSIASLG